MNNEQITGMAKPIIAAIVAYLAASNILFDAQTWNIIISSVVTVGLAIWAYKQNTANSQVRSVDNMAKDPASPVKAIIMNATVAGAAMANDMPGLTTVLEGTAAARSASESGSPAVQSFSGL